MSEPVVEPTPTPSPEPPPTPAPEPSPEPTPEPKAAEPTWRDSFAEEIRDNPSLTKFASVEDLAKGHIEAQKLIGKKGLIPPDENSTPEQIADFYTALGRPETVEGYEVGNFQPPEVLADNWNADGVAEVAAVAHELGVSKAQFDGLVAKMAEVQAANVEGRVQSVADNRAAATSTLEGEWGPAYNEKMASALSGFSAAAEAVGISRDELAGQTLADGSLIGDNVALTKIFAMLGEQGGEMKFAEGSRRLAMTKEEIQSELAEINNNPDLYDRNAPNQKALVARKAELNEMLYPEE